MKSLYRQYNQALKPKIIVIFILNQEKQYFFEFPSHTKIYLIKRYISNYLNDKNLDILYNGNLIRNDLTLKDLVKNEKEIPHLIFQVIDKIFVKYFKEEEEKINSYKQEIMNIKIFNANLNNELIQLEKESNEKESSSYKSLEKVNMIKEQCLKQEQEINELKNELSKINANINVINNLTMKSSDFLINNDNKFNIPGTAKKGNSVVHMDYTIKGKNKNKFFTKTDYSKNEIRKSTIISYNRLNSSSRKKDKLNDTSKNKLTDTSKNKIRNTSQNKIRNTSQNKITDTPKNKITDASKNILSDISKNILNDTPKNKISDISKNILTDVSKNILTETPKNKQPDISKNILTDISKNIFSDTSKNIKNDISNNNNQKEYSAKRNISNTGIRKRYLLLNKNK